MRAPHFRLGNRLRAAGCHRTVRDCDIAFVFTDIAAIAGGAARSVDPPRCRPVPQLALDGASANP